MSLNRKYKEKLEYEKELTGSVAKWMGLSDEGVRMYERYGLLHSDKDAQNNYRSFDIMDMTMLLYSQVYRESGFTLRETQKLANSCTLEEIHTAYQERCEAQRKALEREQLRLRRVMEITEDIKSVRMQYGQCSIEMSPAMYRVEFMKKFKTIRGNERQACVGYWMKEYLPFAMLSTRYYQETLACAQEKMDAASGLGMYAKYAEALGVTENEYVTYHSPFRAVHAILSASNEMLTPDMGNCLAYIRDNGLQICGDAIGFGIVNTNFSDAFKRYYHIWIPIR